MAAHEGSINTVAIVEAVARHGGWLSANRAGELAGVHRNTADRILSSLATVGWVEAAVIEGQQRYRVAHRLAALSLGVQRRILRRIQRQQARWQKLEVEAMAWSGEVMRQTTEGGGR